ncbi:MAG: DUF1631 family protein [Halioglobus sp.]|nr:DUF1631 family protein [Halioglobus sp.]
MLDRYGESASPQADTLALTPDEVLEYLKNTTDCDKTPLAAIMAQTEAIGDPAVPSREHTAILTWLGRAFELWEREYPLEAPLPGQLRNLKPLCTALALFDDRFLQPGAHPMHQFLDILHARAVGWQPSLDRVAAVLEQQIAVASDHARTWFDNEDLDLANVRDEFSAAIERDQARAARMTQRVIDTERGKVKTIGAKGEAVRMLNAAIEKYAVPRDIEDFIKGPWYSSAQLLLLKFGPESEQWLKMSETTDLLMDSLQSLEDATEERRQYIFKVVTQLPKEMRRWLLSLHHDTEAVNEAMGLVEYTHLRILRRQPVELDYLAPLPAPEGAETGRPATTVDIGDCEEGQWFRIALEKDAALRAQLALRADEAKLLLFTNMAGIKVLQIGFSEFADLLESGKVTPITSGHSFSRSLAKAAGIETTELLEALVEVMGEAPTGESPSPRQPASETALALKLDKDVDSGPVPGAVDRSTDDNPLDLPLVDELEPEALGNLYSAGADKTVASEGSLMQQAQALGGEETATAVPASRAPEAVECEPAEPAAMEPEISPPTGKLSAQSPEDLLERQINLPAGTWLGFHDEDVPMMARLAVHDPEEDRFIFVNRKGLKMREMTKAQLLTLIDESLVDILQRSVDFRDRLVDVRKTYDD